MYNLSVKVRAFLLAFIPMLFITSVLSVYFINNELSDIDIEINEQGKMIARHLAHASEYGVFSGNHENLNALLKLSKAEKDVESIIITDKTGTLLAKIPERTSLNFNSPPVPTTNSRVFRHPIVLLTTPVDDINEPDNSENIENSHEILGWILAELSTTRLKERQNQIITNAIYMILLGMVASIMLALWISRGLTVPISRLINSVQRIENGELDINIDRSSSGEIGSLENGVGSMLEKIRISQNELQKRIDETTSGLTDSLKILAEQNQEISAARKEALFASKAKTRFLANMSHEIRTPMNGILGFIKLLKNTTTTKEQNNYLDTIEKSANNLLRLIDDILDISMVESGKIQINNISFNIEKCIEDVITLMTPAAKDKGIEITSFHYSDTPNVIYAPQDRIRQIIINYLGNAIKFSETGTIVIRTMLSPKYEQGEAIMISVTDQGAGISEHDIGSLFSPFNQLDDTSTKQHSGTGLGLAISKFLAKAMGGEVGVESKIDYGSTFWFSFQYKTDFPNNMYLTSGPTHKTHAENPKNTSNELDGSNILIAEDNEINTKFLKTVLEIEGAKTFCAINGKEAIEIYLNNSIDLILMDIHMPVMNGVDATKHIRKLEAHEYHIPIIGVTANAIEEDIKIFKSSGIDTILLKPIATDDLLHEIRYFLRKKNKDLFENLNINGNIVFGVSSDILRENQVNRLGVDHELTSTLRVMLINELPQIKQQLNSHYFSKNWGDLHEQIHKLLGGTAYCDVPELRKAALSTQKSLKGESNSLDDDYKSLILEINILIES